MAAGWYACVAPATHERVTISAGRPTKNKPSVTVVCAVRRVKTAMYCPRVGDCSKQNSAYSSVNALFFCLEVRLDGKTRAAKAV